MTDPRFEKLPKWAQEHLRTVEYERDRMREERDLAQSASPGSAAGVLLNTDGRGWRRLPAFATLRFQIGKHPTAAWVDVRVEDDDTIVVRGGDSIVVFPWTSNTVKVRLAR